MKITLSLIAFLFLQLNIYAQATFTISGAVKNAKGEKLASATVFLAGSEKVTATNADGDFAFDKIEPGTYQLVVSLVGYESVKQNIVVQDKSITDISMRLGEKEIQLNEVVIGDKNLRKTYIKTFTKYFLGESDNAKACKIMNPDLIEFSTVKNVLKASTPEFLIIQNDKLGYKIKYLLKSFSYNSALDVTLYDGDYVFEQLQGTAEQLTAWKKNRKEAYQGSLMHYLRCLHAHTSRQQGFVIYKITNAFFPMHIESVPLVPDFLLVRPDSNFFSFRTKARLYIVYDKKLAAKDDTKIGHVQDWQVSDLASTGSILAIDGNIDQRGSYAGYKDLLIQGFWGRKRLADQLPLEYTTGD